MRRFVALVAVLAVGVGVAAAPVAVAAPGDLPPGHYLWVATDTETRVYERDGTDPNRTPLAVFPNYPTGNMVRDPVLDVIYVPTQYGIDVFNAAAPGWGGTYTNPPVQKYIRVAVTPGGSKVYGLRSGGEAVDVFTNLGSPISTITLPGAATDMSASRPPDGDLIVLGSIAESGTGNYQSAVIRTSDDSLSPPFNAGSRHVVNGSVWSLDGSYLSMAARNVDSTTGSILRYAPPSGITEFPAASDTTPSQIILSPDGTQLFVPSLGINQGQSNTLEYYDAATLANTRTLPYMSEVNPSWGVPAWSPDNVQYWTVNQQGSVAPAVSSSRITAFNVGDCCGFIYSLLVADRPAEVQATSGAGQTMYVDRVFDSGMVVTVVDPAGIPLPGQAVRFDIEPDTAARFNDDTLSPVVVTGPDGRAASELVVAGPQPGGFTVTATVKGLPPATFPLTIIPTPQPTITSLTAGNGTVAVVFTPPTGSISPITSYQVTATDVFNPSGGGQTATGTTSPITVTGLTNGDTYTFTVTAFTAEGDLTSAPSDRIVVGIPPSIAGTPPAGTVGQPYQFTFTVLGVPTPNVALNPNTPLPAGLSFDQSTATISGTPTIAGSTQLTFTASNALGGASTFPTLVINPSRSTCDQAISEAGTGSGTYGDYELVQAPARGGSGSQVVLGTSGNDRLAGGSGDDVLCGLEGDDVLLGGSGDDHLDGGAGYDTLQGGSGTDVLASGEVNDGGSGQRPPR